MENFLSRTRTAGSVSWTACAAGSRPSLFSCWTSVRNSTGTSTLGCFFFAFGFSFFFSSMIVHGDCKLHISGHHKQVIHREVDVLWGGTVKVMKLMTCAVAPATTPSTRTWRTWCAARWRRRSSTSSSTACASRPSSAAPAIRGSSSRRRRAARWSAALFRLFFVCVVADLSRCCIAFSKVKLDKLDSDFPWEFGLVLLDPISLSHCFQSQVEKDFASVYSRLVLCKTFRLDEDGKVLTPEELLYRCVQQVNITHDQVLLSFQLDANLTYPQTIW